MLHATGYKPTSTNSGRRLRSGQRGFTLSELVIAMGISVIVLATGACLSLYSSKMMAAMYNYMDLNAGSRLALDSITRELRQANRLTSATSTAITIENVDGMSVSYSYVPADKNLVRRVNGVERIILKECDSFTFSIYQRNPIGGSFDQYPSATAATCKLLSMSWTRSRKIPGSARNTEQIQTAKVVLRNQKP